MSDNDIAINFTIKPTWSIIKKIQERTVNYMESRGQGKDITEATMMCVTELIENAVKYGAETPDGENIEFDLRLEGNKILIRVSNGVNSEKDLSSIKVHIEKINKSDNPSELYTQRLQELLEDSRPSVSQLGLYRIAYEGQFSMNYEFNHGKLTILAERTI